MSTDLATAPIRSLFFKYYVPALTSLLSVTLHQVINAIILSRYAGNDAVAAIGLFGPVFTIFIALTLPLAIGGGILTSRSIGSGDILRVSRMFNACTTAILLAGMVIAVMGPIITWPITELLTGSRDSAVAKSTYDYMFWAFLWMPGFFIRMVWGSFITNDNHPRVARNASIAAVVLNIALDFLFIIVLHMGAKGASIATGISIYLSVFVLVVHLVRTQTHVSLNAFKFTLAMKDWKVLLSFGLPTFASELSFSAGLLLLNKTIVGYGPAAVSAFGVINQISFILLRLFTAAMMSALPLLAYNIGAKRPDRVIDIFNFSLIFTLVLGAIVCAFGLLFPVSLLSLFGRVDEAFESFAIPGLRFYFLLFLAAGANYIFAAYLQAIGKVTESIVFNILKSLLLTGLFAAVLPLALGISGVWMARAAGEVFAMVLVALAGYALREKYFSAEAILKKLSAGD